MSSNLATTSNMQLVIARENEWGEPASSDYQTLRIKGQSLDLSKSCTESAEIRSDRNITDIVDTSLEAGGQIDFELSFESYDDLFAGTLFNEWSEPLNINVDDGEIIVASVSNEILHNQGELVFADIAIGQWIQLTTTDNSGYYQVLENTGERIKLSGALTDELADSLKITGSYICNGITPKSYTIERQHLGIEQYFLFTGMHVSQMSLNFASEAMLEGSFTFLGKDAVRSDTTSVSNIISAPTTPNTNSVDNFGQLRESGTTQGYIKSLSLEIDNNLRGQKAIANVGLVGVAPGRCRVSGKLEAYFQDGALYNKFRDGTPLSLDWRLTDNDGNTMIFTLPKCKLSNGSISAGSADEDVMATFDFQAILDDTTGCSIQLDKFTGDK